MLGVRNNRLLRIRCKCFIHRSFVYLLGLTKWLQTDLESKFDLIMINESDVNRYLPVNGHSNMRVALMCGSRSPFPVAAQGVCSIEQLLDKSPYFEDINVEYLGGLSDPELKGMIMSLRFFWAGISYADTRQSGDSVILKFRTVRAVEARLRLLIGRKGLRRTRILPLTKQIKAALLSSLPKHLKILQSTFYAKMIASRRNHFQSVHIPYDLPTDLPRAFSKMGRPSSQKEGRAKGSLLTGTHGGPWRRPVCSNCREARIKVDLLFPLTACDENNRSLSNSARSQKKNPTCARGAKLRD